MAQVSASLPVSIRANGPEPGGRLGTTGPFDEPISDGNGIELCSDLLSEHADLRRLVLTSYTCDETMLDAIMAGASDTS